MHTKDITIRFKGARGMTARQRTIAQRRRLRALADVRAVAAGQMKLTKAAKKYKVVKESIKLWIAQLDDSSPSGMKEARSGRFSKLGAGQHDRLRNLYNDGAKAAGFDSDLWDAERFIKAVKDTFHVEYSVITANRYMKEFDPEKKKRIYHPSGPARKVKAEAEVATPT